MLNQLPAWERLAKEIIWQQIGELKGKTILDFGSGIGITADYFASNNQVTAIEPSEAEFERVLTDLSIIFSKSFFVYFVISFSN